MSPRSPFAHWSAVSLTGSSSGHVIALDQSGARKSTIRAHSTTVGPYKAKNVLHILKHNQLQSLKGAREEWLQFCWDFVKSPWNDEIALQHFFFLACSSARIFFLFHLCCMQLFSSDKGLQEIFFRNHPHPPSRVKWSAP